MKKSVYIEIKYLSHDPVKFIKELQERIEEHQPVSIDITCKQDYGSEYGCIELTVEREETAIEKQEREVLEQRVKAHRKQMYAQLKKEFEGTK